MIYYVVQEEDIQMVEEQFRGDFGGAETELTKVLKEDMDSFSRIRLSGIPSSIKLFLRFFMIIVRLSGERHQWGYENPFGPFALLFLLLMLYCSADTLQNTWR